LAWNACFGDRQEPPCATIYLLSSAAPAFSGEPVASGNRPRKRNPSIATSSHTAKCLASRYPFSSSTAKDANASTHPDLSCCAPSLPSYRSVYQDFCPVCDEDSSAPRRQKHCQYARDVTS